MSYEDWLSIVGLTTLETRRLRAEMIEVYKMLGGLEGTDEIKNIQRRVRCTRGHDWKLFKKRIYLDAGKFCFRNRVCDKWKKLPGWDVDFIVESRIFFIRNLDHYLRDDGEFK